MFKTYFQSIFKSKLFFFLLGAFVWHQVLSVRAYFNYLSYCDEYPQDEICL